MRIAAAVVLTLIVLLASFVPGVWGRECASAREAPPVVRDAGEALRGSQPEPGRLAFLGVVTTAEDGRLAVARVVEGSAAERAGLRVGDVIRELAGRSVSSAVDLQEGLDACAPGDHLRMTLVRDHTLLDREILLGGRRRAERLFRGASFRLAVVPLLFSDDTERARRDDELRRFFFADTGLERSGASLRDYYSAQSLGALDLDGRVLPPLRLTRPRAFYASQAMGAASGSAYREAARLLGERVGMSGLREFDGVVFLYDGAVETTPGRALWPHRAVILVGGRRLPYYVHSSQTVTRGEIGEHCHEFGHLLGLEDMYGEAHLTGAGDFCVMAIGHRGGARSGAAVPFSMCASCRLRLGWIDCVTVDPATPQRLRLRPAGGRGAHAIAVPLDHTTSEYLLLEVRAPRGFDADLPSTGLVVWRVGGVATPGQGAFGQRVDLVEAHGVDAIDASLVRPHEIAFPTARASDLTPATIPSSRSLRPGAYEVHLTDIAREPDGCVVLSIGMPRSVRQTAPDLRGIDLPVDGRVTRTDPITGAVIVFDVSAEAVLSARDGDTPSRR